MLIIDSGSWLYNGRWNPGRQQSSKDLRSCRHWIWTPQGMLTFWSIRMRELKIGTRKCYWCKTAASASSTSPNLYLTRKSWKELYFFSYMKDVYNGRFTSLVSLIKKKKLLHCVLWGPNMEEISGDRWLEKTNKFRLQKCNRVLFIRRSSQWNNLLGNWMHFFITSSKKNMI